MVCLQSMDLHFHLPPSPLHPLSTGGKQDASPHLRGPAHWHQQWHRESCRTRALGDWQGHCTSWVDRAPWAARTWPCVLPPLWALCHRASTLTNSENALRSGLVFAQGFMRDTEKGGIDTDKARSIHIHSCTDPIGVQCMHGATRAPTCLQVGPGWQSPPKQRARTASLLAPQL
jgi:hypothetical protein